MTLEHEIERDTRDDEIADLNAEIGLLRAQIAAAQPALLREAIRDAGYDPQSQQGRILTELARNPDFQVDAGYIAHRADELGFDPDEQTPHVSQPAPQVEVPPGKVKEQALTAKNRELAAAIAATMPTPSATD